MLSLGLDPSLTGYGWCIFRSDSEGKDRVVEKGHFATKAKDIFVTRYMALRDLVAGILDRYPDIKVVGIESPPFGEQYSEGLYGLFLYTNEAVYTRRRDVVYFDPGTVKMLVKQNPKLVAGKLSKGDMVRAAKEDTGIKSKWNHNEADAYHVAKFSARFFEYLDHVITDEDLTPSEVQSFARQHTFTKGKKKGLTEKKGLIFRENDRFFRFSRLQE